MLISRYKTLGITLCVHPLTRGVSLKCKDTQGSIMVTEPNYTSIRISRKNYEILRTKGHTPESFDSIISKLLGENNTENDQL
jgi:hypothetical protein